jgi:hypothetical protein
MAPSQITDDHRCTASRLATTDLYQVTAEDESAKVHEDLTERGYDVAPVQQDGDPFGFVRRDTLEDVSGQTPISNHTTTLELKHLIAPDAGFETVLNALYERPRYFIASQNEISGILTRADLNSQPARLHLFTQISLLEQHARELIISEAPNWKEETLLDPEVIDQIDAKQDDAQSNNVDLPVIHYAKLSTITTVLTSYEPCWQALGFATESRASTELHAITQLRNDVVHSNPIIQNTDRGVIEDGRTITDLINTYQRLQQLTQSSH